MVKRKAAKKKVAKSRKYKVSQVKEDVGQRRKFAKGKRIEAYTFGEALGSKKWP